MTSKNLDFALNLYIILSLCIFGDLMKQENYSFSMYERQPPNSFRLR